MTGTFRLRAILDLSRTALTFLGFVAIIIGILAMHVWMGGHGPTAHGSPAQSDSVHGAAVAANPTTTDIGSPTSMGGSHQVQTSDSYPVEFQESTGDSVQGCVASCGDEGIALGMCLLAVIVVAALAFLVRSGRLVPGSVLLRGPPLIRLRPLSIPVPSLIQLCISRT
ncbi:hypothetical protein DXT87_10200 [Arthrobacter sp. AET 35A]|nr:hypothetical protein [Arthrobacter sp. AET 35A]